MSVAAVVFSLASLAGHARIFILDQLSGIQHSEVTTREYDAENRVVEERSPSGAIRKTTYNAAGKVLTSTDALKRVTRYEYGATYQDPVPTRIRYQVLLLAHHVASVERRRKASDAKGCRSWSRRTLDSRASAHPHPGDAG